MKKPFNLSSFVNQFVRGGPIEGYRIKQLIAHAETLAEANVLLTALNKRALEMLKAREWELNDEFATYYCPECQEHKKDGHAKDCTLSQLITELEAEG